jgi:hypothetical protein
MDQGQGLWGDSSKETDSVFNFQRIPGAVYHRARPQPANQPTSVDMLNFLRGGEGGQEGGVVGEERTPDAVLGAQGRCQVRSSYHPGWLWARRLKGEPDGY